MLAARERLEKIAKHASFMANYVSLPCLVVAAVLLFAGRPEMHGFWLMMVGCNGLAYWLQIRTRNRCQTVLDGVSEMERLQRIRSLNPNKGE